MNQEQHFLADITANPDDPAPRLIFADWLEERGDWRGELLRLNRVIEKEEGDQKKLTERRFVLAHQNLDCTTQPDHKGWLEFEFDKHRKREDMIRLFACDCADRVLHFFEDKYPEDTRPRECIRVSRLFACGKASEEERDAARAAAWAAAWGAAWGAAWAAARAAAWDAARAAARAAAWDAFYRWAVGRFMEYLAFDLVASEIENLNSYARTENP